MRGFALVALVLCSGCGTAQNLGAISYVLDEYGSASSDATIALASGDDSQSFKVWIHKQKPKIMVQTASAAVALGSGFVDGVTLGLVDAAPESLGFAQAGATHLRQSISPTCRLSQPNKLSPIAWEFDYDCPAQATPVRKRSK